MQYLYLPQNWQNCVLFQNLILLQRMQYFYCVKYLQIQYPDCHGVLYIYKFSTYHMNYITTNLVSILCAIFHKTQYPSYVLYYVLYFQNSVSILCTISTNTISILCTISTNTVSILCTIFKKFSIHLMYYIYRIQYPSCVLYNYKFSSPACLEMRLCCL